jgi:hypothetical protein
MRSFRDLKIWFHFKRQIRVHENQWYMNFESINCLLSHSWIFLIFLTQAKYCKVSMEQFLFILFLQSEKKLIFRYKKNFFETQLLEVWKFESYYSWKVMNNWTFITTIVFNINIFLVSLSAPFLFSLLLSSYFINF